MLCESWMQRLGLLLVLYVLAAEAAVTQLFGATSPTVFTKPTMFNGASFWQLSNSPTWYLIGWMKVETIVPADVRTIDFYTGWASMDFRQTSTGFYTSCGQIDGLNVMNAWFFFAFASIGSSTFMKIQKEGDTNYYRDSLNYNPTFVVSSAQLTFPSADATSSKVIIVDVRASTDSATSAQIDGFISTPCPSSTTCVCSSPYIWNAQQRSCTMVCTTISNCQFCETGKCTECTNGFYLSGASPACTACDTTCVTCSGSGSSACTACKTNAALTTSPGACSCNAGYYPNSTSASCSTCSITCQTCKASGASACTSCKTNASLTTNPGACSCSTGYYPNTTSAACSACNATCLTCTSSSASACKSCKTGAALTTSPGACSCSIGYYPNTTSASCAACDATCQTCNGAGASACTACLTGASLSSNPGSCSCISGYFPNPTAALCVACNATCLTCSGSGTSACTACKTSAVLSSNPGVCSCIAGYFPNTTSASCTACDSTCQTCSGSSSALCTACKTNASALSNPGACTCSVGFYPNTTSANCSACHGTCLTCSGATSLQCTGCGLNAFLSTSTGDCKCNSDSFRLTAVVNCTKCHSSCLTCNAGLASSCTSCSNPYYLSVQNACVACDVSCSSCTGGGPSKCTGCKLHASLLDGVLVGVCFCDPGYYSSTTTAECAPCPTFCIESCLGLQAADCIDHSALTFIRTIRNTESQLPTLIPSSGLVCYRMPVPIECELAAFTKVTGALDANPSNWVLTQLQCDRYLAFAWPSTARAYQNIFNALSLPTSDMSKKHTTEAILMAWVLQFGYFDLMKNPDWQPLRNFLLSVSDWSKVAAYASPPKYFDGTAEKAFPKGLEDWIKAGSLDFEVFNYWNAVASVCFSATCSVAEASTCCGQLISQISPCCVAHPYNNPA